MTEPTWHSLESDAVARQLKVEPQQGLSQSEVARRRRRHGENRLAQHSHRRPLRILLRQFRSVVILVLAIASGLALALGHYLEAAAVLTVVIINTSMGFLYEWRAARTMDALRQLQPDEIRVRRDGQSVNITAPELVPGDIILLAEGDLVPADARVAEAEGVQCNQAGLTGESISVTKSAETMDADTVLAERSDMLYKGTTITQGAVTAIVVATGMSTELGRIAQLTASAQTTTTPLQARLDRLGHRLAWIVLAITLALVGIGLAAQRDLVVMLETGIALGVAAVPEGLPIVATLALARGMWRMAQRNALIHHLAAVETLGATGVILTDKTGTLTANHMHLETLILPNGEEEASAREQALRVAVLCNNAELSADSDDGNDHGDPMEIALLEAGEAAGLRRSELLQSLPEAREIPFSAERMMMATGHQLSSGSHIAVKGAPEAVLEACDIDEETRQWWVNEVDRLAAQGLRPLMVADRSINSLPEADDAFYQQLIPRGLLGLFDPPRPGVAEAIQACQRAGIRVVMVTGDQPATAQAIAERVGIISGNHRATGVVDGSTLSEALAKADETVQNTQVFARVTPGQKLDIVKAYQANGAVVAMTGDGVNDAPALRQADIGIAMGQRGTDAAREVGDIILQDDRFESIVAAVRQGRGIYENIRRAILFMLCTNFAEVGSVASATLLGIPLPLLPLQILYLNLLTDVFPALALAVGSTAPGVMEKPPRPPAQPILTRGHWLRIGGWSLLIGLSILGALLIALMPLALSEQSAVTVSFLTLGFAKLWFVFSLRGSGMLLWQGSVAGNPWIWAALGLCTGLLLAAVYLPGLNHVLGTEKIAASGWALVIAASLLPLLVGELHRLIRRVLA